MNSVPKVCDAGYKTDGAMLWSASCCAGVAYTRSMTDQQPSSGPCLPRAGSDMAELLHTAIKGWQDRLAAACILRTIPAWRQRGTAVVATSGTAAPSLPDGWRQDAEKQLTELTAAGVAVDVDRCICMVGCSERRNLLPLLAANA